MRSGSITTWRSDDRHERCRGGVRLAAEAREQHGARQRGGRAREQRSAEPAADEQWSRSRGCELEAAAERAEHGELRALARDRGDAGSSRLAQEPDDAFLVAHGRERTRQQRLAVERAQHVEPSRRAGHEIAADAHEAIRPQRLDAEHAGRRQQLSQRRAPRAGPAAPSARRAWRARSRAPRPRRPRSS